jgi:hypothetical protein
VLDDAVRGHRLAPGVHMLIADAHRSGMICERPLIWRSNKAPTRHGLWWTHAHEHIVAFKRSAGPLPYFDWKATATSTKYPTAGAFRQRRKDGSRPARLTPYVAPSMAHPRDILHAKVGGGHMGHPLASRGEAPFPESLIEQIIPVLVPIGGRVLDPFSGSGTVPAVAQKLGRFGVGSDLRMNQCELGRERCATPNAKYVRTKPAAELSEVA